MERAADCERPIARHGDRLFRRAHVVALHDVHGDGGRNDLLHASVAANLRGEDQVEGHRGRAHRGIELENALGIALLDFTAAGDPQVGDVRPVDDAHGIGRADAGRARGELPANLVRHALDQAQPARRQDFQHAGLGACQTGLNRRFARGDPQRLLAFSGDRRDYRRCSGAAPDDFARRQLGLPVDDEMQPPRFRARLGRERHSAGARRSRGCHAAEFGRNMTALDHDVFRQSVDDEPHRALVAAPVHRDRQRRTAALGDIHGGLVQPQNKIAGLLAGNQAVAVTWTAPPQQVFHRQVDPRDAGGTRKPMCGSPNVSARARMNDSISSGSRSPADPNFLPSWS